MEELYNNWPLHDLGLRIILLLILNIFVPGVTWITNVLIWVLCGVFFWFGKRATEVDSQNKSRIMMRNVLFSLKNLEDTCNPKDEKSDKEDTNKKS